MSSIMRLRNGVIILSFRVVISRRARPAPQERISRPRHTGDCLPPSRRSRPFNLRRTQADAENTKELLALHRGEGRPRVHRMIERQTVPTRDDMPIKQNPEVP
jgi:hypothetical protein